MNEFQKVWKQLASEKKLTSADMAVLSLVKAIRKDDPLTQAKFYLKQNFKPISAKRKLDNGAYKHFALYSALWTISNIRKDNVSTASLIQTLSIEELAKVQVLRNNILGSRGYGMVAIDE